MALPYRRGKTIIRRDPGGRFRKSTLADVGLGIIICDDCGGFNPYPAYTETAGFVEPSKPPVTCSHCGKELTNG